MSSSQERSEPPRIQRRANWMSGGTAGGIGARGALLSLTRRIAGIGASGSGNGRGVFGAWREREDAAGG